jgi:hypothetical protein
VSAPTSGYAVRLAIDYQEPLDRLTTALRVIWALPILAVLTAVTSTVRGGLFLPVLVMILFRQKYPRWWYEWNLALTRFSTRVIAYVALLTDRYPSTDEEQAVHLDIDYPDVPTDLNRWLPLVKWLLAIPHYIVVALLAVAAVVAVIIAWFAILFTGRYPQGLFRFVVGVLRWGTRVEGYAFLLVTDRYPPFSLDPA